MGVIIVDGRAALQFKGSISRFEKAIVGVRKLQEVLGASSLMIDTVPMPDSPGIIIGMHFTGPMSEFEKVIAGLDRLRASVAIDTVPLPERLMIGTWPTPEKPVSPLRWVISARVKRTNVKR